MDEQTDLTLCIYMHIWTFVFWIRVKTTCSNNVNICSFFLQAYIKRSQCQNEHITLECPSSSKILVHSAFYGRRIPGIEKCPSDDTTECISDELVKVMNTCDGSRNCRFWVASFFFREDPCPGINKYLEVEYLCDWGEYMSDCPIYTGEKCSGSVVECCVRILAIHFIICLNLVKPSKKGEYPVVSTKSCPWRKTLLEIKCKMFCVQSETLKI